MNRPDDSSNDSSQTSEQGRLFVDHRIHIPLSDLQFTFVRSSGPGGQNVNKVNSKAVLRWDFEASRLPDSVKDRFRNTFRTRITQDGHLVLSSQRYRDQVRNRQDCLEKLKQLLLSVAQEPTRRKATKPSAGVRRRRRQQKQHQASKKRMRKPPGRDE